MLTVEVMEAAMVARWNALLLEGPGDGYALRSFAWGAFKATQGWFPHRLTLRQEGRVIGAAQLLVRQLPRSELAIAYCPKGPWLDWGRPEHVNGMLAGRGSRPFRHALCPLRSGRSTVSGLAARLPDGGTPPGRSRQGRSPGGAALAALRAADGHTPAREVFRERGYHKARWDTQFRTTRLVDPDRPLALCRQSVVFFPCR